MTYQGKKLSSVIVSDVNHRDAPDYSDAFLEEAYLNCEDRFLTESEMESDEIYEQLSQHISENQL